MAKKKLPSRAKIAKTSKKKAHSKKTAAKKKVAAKPIKKPVKKKAAKRKSKGVDLECFLTTACVHYFHLPDNAYELETLRNYRDTYLLAQKDGRDLVKEYYRIAPALVIKIENDTERATIYAFIYSEIKKACSEIQNQAYEVAKCTYKKLVETLQKRYTLTT